MSLVLILSAISPLADRGLSEPIMFDPKVKESASVTQQQFSKDADINNIMSKYRKTGVLVNPLDPDSQRVPLYMDVSGLGDFQAVQERLDSIRSAFLTLPAKVRDRFGNSPALAIDFMAKPENLIESIDLGLLPESLRPKGDDSALTKGAAAAAAAGQAAEGGASASA